MVRATLRMSLIIETIGKYNLLYVYIYIYGDVCKMWGRHHLDLIQYLQE
jgi:hypothetical protein